MFVEEGFRLRFSNGEVIDFYADKTSDKEDWMRELSKVVGKDSKVSKSWTDIVLKRERMLAAKGAKGTKPRAGRPSSGGMKSTLNTPAARRPHAAAAPESRQHHPQRPNPTRPHSQQQVGRPASQQDVGRPGSQQQVGRSSPNKPLMGMGFRDPRGLSQADRRAKTRSMIF